MSILDFDEQQFNELLTTLIVLTAKGYLTPTLPEYNDRHSQVTTQFNNTIIEQVIAGKELVALASPVLGTGVTMARYEQLFLWAYDRNYSLAKATAEVLEDLNQRVTKNGQPIENYQEHLGELSRREQIFINDRLPILQQLKITDHL